MAAPIFTDRETARRKLEAKVADQTRLLEQIRAEATLPPWARSTFTTISPEYLLGDARERLRWIDCAPEGANHLVAPLQDMNGTPMGTVRDANMGPCAALRDARAARGLHPISGRPLEQTEVV